MGTELLNERIVEVEEPQFLFAMMPVNDIDHWWERVIRGAVEDVKRRTNPSWPVARVYHWLATDAARAGLTFFGDELVAVTIVCADGDRLASPRDGLVLLAWSDPKNRSRGIDEAVRKYTQHEVENHAREAGFRRLKMFSPRIGMLGRPDRPGRKGKPGFAIRLGWRLGGLMFVKDL
jgi:hypothetical protein